MQNYNTIIGVIQMRQNECSHSMIQNRYHIGSGTAQLILNRFNASGFSLEQLKQMEPSDVEMLFYPPENLKRKEYLSQISNYTMTVFMQKGAK